MENNKIKRVWAVYFSPTGTTKKVVCAIADGIARQLVAGAETGAGSGAEVGAGSGAEAGAAERMDFDFTPPGARQEAFCLGPEDLAVFGAPVYAGRVPNVLLKYLATVRGGGGPAVPVVLFGNRNYDDALIELRDILADAGFCIPAAAAFVGEHSFSRVLGAGRPDERDMALAREFALAAADKLAEGASSEPVFVKGTPRPYRGYYQPRDRKGNPVDIRKVKPLTGPECNDCGLCARICPMGSISPENVREFTGICIKCGACIKGCPKGAKYYDDHGYLYHQHELEEGYTRRAEPELFF